MLTLIGSCEGLTRFEEWFSIFLSTEISPATAGSMEPACLPWPGKQTLAPAEEPALVHGLEDRGKYSCSGRISMNICSGTDSAGTLRKNIFEKNIPVKI
jgi:hypothetical protein